MRSRSEKRMVEKIANNTTALALVSFRDDVTLMSSTLETMSWKEGILVVLAPVGNLDRWFLAVRATMAAGSAERRRRTWDSAAVALASVENPAPSLAMDSAKER